MKSLCLLFLLLIVSCNKATAPTSTNANQEEFTDFIKQIESEYIYNSDKPTLVQCLKDKYQKDVDTITAPYYKVLFYETILNEFHDSHISLNTNTDKSYRLRSPIYVALHENKFYVKNIFSSQLNESVSIHILNSEIESFNGIEFNEVIDQFSSKCIDKTDPVIREWIANKIIAGKRSEPRILTISSDLNDSFTFDVDALELKQDTTNLSSEITDDIGYIRINNTLGNSQLVDDFDRAIDDLMNTQALVLDLRNTPNGGNTDVAEPIMGRFTSETIGYQVCENKNTRYTKEVAPRKKTYTQPVYVLVGRWTGSMGEGMAIGFNGMNRGTIVGTEMNRLAGGVKTIKLLNSNFGFHLPFEKMYHINGTLREDFVPEEYVNQINTTEDDYLNHVIRMIKSR